MLKKDEVSDPESCINKARPDEPVFVLRGQDKLAPQLVRDWAYRAAQAGTPPRKVEEAYRQAFEIDEWQVANGNKTPD